ncbi:ParB family protein [Xanthomonas hortorum]|uniref:ParB family protein n=1 Tax=Xanthomonas hortorum TaxID=56454 RepID=UPI0029358E12|nr:ParB family protein [Xanthomonas hortorum]MDV2451786.1 ParB family protein [Xanthomonas hortorum NBC5720]
MAEITPQDMAGKLLAAGFQRNGESASALSDPIADTPMVVTLDQLRPYEHDPRVKRNPAYEEIKASIRERGLDAPPTITRRPGEEHFIIRSGGNTRLAILRDLWSETKQERFYRISCLFRPWPERGEIVALTGHLAENELRGGLTFIERALGVEKVRELYEKEKGSALSQSELARRLSADGYPIQQSHISRMQDAVQHLLPAIPTLLYGGLGRHQVERVAVLRKACERIWQRYSAARTLTVDFREFFQDVLAQFDAQPDAFNIQRVQDELLGQMADLLGVDYDTLTLDLNDSESRQRALATEPAASSISIPHPALSSAPQSNLTSVTTPEGNVESLSTTPSPSRENPAPAKKTIPADLIPAASKLPSVPAASADQEVGDLVQEHIVSPAQTTERLQSIQRLIANELGDTLPPDFEGNVLQAIPVQAGGLYPITDVWYIEPGLDIPDRLRVHIAQFANEIAEAASLADCIVPCNDGIGFKCKSELKGTSDVGGDVVMLLAALSGQGSIVEMDRFGGVLPRLLHGAGDPAKRLSDTALVKLFRLLRLARRLLDIENSSTSHGS